MMSIPSLYSADINVKLNAIFFEKIKLQTQLKSLILNFFSNFKPIMTRKRKFKFLFIIS